MDISSYKITSEPVELKIKHPETEKDTDIIVKVISPEHPEYKSRIVELKRKWLNDKGAVDVLKIADSRSHLIVNMIEGWSGIELNGEKFEYSKENAFKLVTEWTWIADQINEFCALRENFFVGSKKV